MLPEVAALGPFTLHSYGLLIALGVLLSIFLMKKSARQFGFPPAEKVIDLIFVVVFSGFIGARLFYIVQEWAWYREHPWEIIQIWKGGLVYYGGMVASFAGFFIYVRSARLPFLASADFMMPYISFTHALGRIGCFLNGCCYGKACNLPWAVRFPFLPQPVHPTQLYEAFFNLGLFGFLVWLYPRRAESQPDSALLSTGSVWLPVPRRRFVGEITALYLILYPLGRFFLEYFRGDQPPLLFSLTFHQGLSLAFLLVGICLYGIYRRRR